MNAATCGALSAVFPLILLSIGVERRNLAMKLRQWRWYRRIAIAGLSAGLIGTVLAIVGIQTDGYAWPSAFFIWTAFAVAIFALGLVSLMLMASHEIEEDAASD